MATERYADKAVLQTVLVNIYRRSDVQDESLEAVRAENNKLKSDTADFLARCAATQKQTEVINKIVVHESESEPEYDAGCFAVFFQQSKEVTEKIPLSQTTQNSPRFCSLF